MAYTFMYNLTGSMYNSVALDEWNGSVEKVWEQ